LAEYAFEYFLADFLAVLVALAATVALGGLAAHAAPAPATITTAIATTTECDGTRKILRITSLLDCGDPLPKTDPPKRHSPSQGSRCQTRLIAVVAGHA
jgi:hypothetical protein